MCCAGIISNFLWRKRLLCVHVGNSGLKTAETLLIFTLYLIIFNFHITNFPFLSSNIPSSPAYGVFISQLIRYARASSSYECFILRAVRLSNKLLGQGYVKERLKSSLRKFYGRYGDLIKQYEVPLSRMLHDILDDDHLQWHPPLIRHYTNFDPITDLDLITEFDFLPNCERFP